VSARIAPQTIIVAAIGAAVGLFGMAFSAVMGLLLGGGIWNQISGFGLFSGMIAIPLSLAILFLSTAITSVHYTRMWVFAIASVLALVGSVLMALGFGAEQGWVEGIVGAILFYGMPIALAWIGLAYNAAIGIPAARAADHTARLDRLAELIGERGHLTFDEAAAEIGVTLEAAVELAVEVRRTGRCVLEIDLHRGRMWGRTWADSRCAQLRDDLGIAGRVELEAFASANGVPTGMVREWLYTLVYRRQLTGYISWEEGVLYSADATALRGSSRCPSCSGQLELVSRGVIECQHCDTQTLL